jgi:hypothetical protein
MKPRIIAVAVAIACLLGGIAGTTAASASSAPAVRHFRLPVVYGLPIGHLHGTNFFSPRIRPTGAMSFTADGSGYMVMHSYSRWTRSAGVGTATTYAFRSGHTIKGPRTMIRFFRVRTHHGQRYFTRVFIRNCWRGHSGTAFFQSRFQVSWAILRGCR